jgi:hypothetical protein
MAKITGPTLDAFLRRGYLFKESIPLFNCDSFADWYDSGKSSLTKRDYPQNSRGVVHTFPKDFHSRRTLTFPNPANFAVLAKAISENWSTLFEHCAQSPFSASNLRVPKNPKRALSYFRPALLEKRRITERVGSSYYLYTDLTRFFPSIYTHSFEWVFDNPLVKGQRNSGLGSKLDNLSRAIQGGESIGIPLGPDTSFVLAEAVATAVDLKLSTSTTVVRHVDDFYIYASSTSAIDNQLSKLVQACGLMRLELNSAKTQRGSVPDSLEEPWVSEIRPLAATIRSRTSLITFLDRILALDQQNRGKVLSYGLASARKIGLKSANWTYFESFILTGLLTNAKAIPITHSIFAEAASSGLTINSRRLRKAANTFLMHHASLGHSYEVANMLWLLFEIEHLQILNTSTVAQISRMEDDFVAVMSLWLREQSLLNIDTALWQKLVAAPGTETGTHWLLRHESAVHGWLHPSAPSSGFGKAMQDARVSFVRPIAEDQDATEEQEDHAPEDDGEAAKIVYDG